MFRISSLDIARAWSDLGRGAAATHVWGMLGWQEIRQRYRRSTLGPLWLTLSTGVLIASMGPLYGKLLGQDISVYFPFLAIGLIVWNLLASLVNDSCAAFIAAESLIKQINLPLSVHVLRMVWKNLIIFAHNTLIMLAVLLFFPQSWGWNIALIPLALLLIAVNGWWIGLFLGMAGARFRDISPIVASVVQIAFFLTPVLWSIDQLGRHRWAATWNPLYHFLEIVRAPLLGSAITPVSWQVVVATTFAGWMLTFALFSRYRARIAYWV
jgi:ABC-type polysaccharide/polyol phosphate export permease